jgi:prepilin-type N-terminal cleavage/methylation domain-containing protein
MWYGTCHSQGQPAALERPRRTQGDPVLRRNGFTLVETLIVIVVISLVGLIAVPRMTAAKAQSEVRGVRGRVASIYAAARTSAVSSSRITTVHVSGNKIWVTATPRLTTLAGSNMDTIIRPENLMTSSHIAVTSSAATFTISQAGIGQNTADVTITASKSGHSASVTIKKYGQVVR